MHAIKSLKNKTITLLLVVALTLSMLFGAVMWSLAGAAKADTTEDTQEFAPTSLGLSNTQFDSSSGSYPASPSSWTGSSLDNGKGKVISGVIDLTAKTYFGEETGNKAYKLDQYDEYGDDTMPVTIFGENSEHKDTDAKTLMINTAEEVEAAYGYTSGEMSFVPNSFYRVSVWVKTGNFAPDTGATVKLTGLGQNCSFMNINTVKNLSTLNKNNNYGWKEYKFYVRSSASLTKTVSLVLAVGDGGNADDELPDISSRPAHGYAFFDTVKAERITAHDFAKETSMLTIVDGKDNVYNDTTGTVLALDMYELDSFTITDENGDDLEIGTFSQNVDMWKTNVKYNENSTDLSYTGTAHSKVYNSESRIPDLDDSKVNVNGFTKNPWAPLGRAEYNDVANKTGIFDGKNNANIMLINTYNKTKFNTTAYGIASPTVTINRYKYYRFGVWVKGDNITTGDGISILVKGKAKSANSVKLLTSYTGLDGDETDAEHYGWKEQVVYIKGSALEDYEVRFELWLGTPDAMSDGIAMFDNVTFTKLDYSEYSNMSTADGGNIYTIDTAEDETGVTNGNFSAIGDFDELEYPLPVADWTFITPDSVTANGFSTAEVNTDTAKYGIITATDDRAFNGLGIRNPAKFVTVDNQKLYNVLVMTSKTPTAIGYQSASVTLAIDQANQLSVDMAVDCKDCGYGASLVLKTTEGDVISTIENITDTYGKFVTYTFYLDAPLSEQTVYVEIWLGLNDRQDNTKKLSSGTVYVSKVALNSWTAADDSTIEQEFEQKLDEYKAAVLNEATLKALKFGVYSFTRPSLEFFDAYSYAADDGLGYLYNWSVSSANGSVKSGMFNSDNMKDLTIYKGFDKKDLSGNMLYIFNTEKNYTTYTYGNTISLVASTYYRIDVDVKVKLSAEMRDDENAIGANIKLTGPNVEFTNIKDTSTYGAVGQEESRDYETFKRYTFYISTGDDGGNIGLQVSLGGSERAGFIQGGLVIGGIKMTKIDNIDFENAEAEEEDNDYIMTVKLSEVDDGSDDEVTEATSPEVQWWIIPTIIFSAALLAAVIIIIAIRIRDWLKAKRKKKGVTYESEYGREDAYKDIERLRARKDQAEAEGKPMDIEPDEIEEVEDEPTAEEETEEKAEETEAKEADEAESTESKEESEKTEETKEPETKEEAPNKKERTDTDLDD
ncbi:MAG: hypothetical protein HDT28_06520 [Clostridiales bacterium]|nr:hypothetical protein [Clostridiales bacterium]